jgi:hypothetical protein
VFEDRGAIWRRWATLIEWPVGIVSSSV